MEEKLEKYFHKIPKSFFENNRFFTGFPLGAWLFLVFVFTFFIGIAYLLSLNGFNEFTKTIIWSLIAFVFLAELFLRFLNFLENKKRA